MLLLKPRGMDFGVDVHCQYRLYICIQRHPHRTEYVQAVNVARAWAVEGLFNYTSVVKVMGLVTI
jgi:hypothetical protein